MMGEFNRNLAERGEKALQSQRTWREERLVRVPSSLMHEVHQSLAHAKPPKPEPKPE